MIREPEDLPGGLELERATVDQASGVAVDKRSPYLRIKKLGASLSPLGLKDFFRLEGTRPQAIRRRRVPVVPVLWLGRGCQEGVVRLSLNHPDEALPTMNQ